MNFITSYLFSYSESVCTIYYNILLNKLFKIFKLLSDYFSEDRFLLFLYKTLQTVRNRTRCFTMRNFLEKFNKVKEKKGRLYLDYK